MLFNSINFFVFFVIVLMIYYIIPKRLQCFYLLLASFSYYIYWNPKYSVFLLISICTTYFLGLMISHKRSTNGNSKPWIIIGIVTNIGLLLFFKYSQMLLDTFNQIENILGRSNPPIQLNLFVPIGISFYTFKVISYIIDIYNGKIEPEKNWGKYALYVSFFPQIVSGPIERSHHFLPQLENGIYFNYDNIKDGFLNFIWGLLKKIVIADRLTILVDQIFNNVYSYGTPAYLTAIVFFTLQIYFDFSGYSDMSIGCSKMLGFDTVQNFNRPYFSTSIADFWRKWHISLSTWFKDYLYIPLGGNRVSTFRQSANLMIVFLASGMWHGSNWTFLIWGGLHGIYQIIGRITKNKRAVLLEKLHIKNSPIHLLFSHITTFILVAYAWMFFRANTIHDAIHITKSLVLWDNKEFDILNLGMNRYDFKFSIIILIIWFFIELIQSKIQLRTKLQAMILPIRWGIYLTIIFTCILFGIYGDLSSASFIYFQF